MALLKKKTRIRYFSVLGLGDYNSENIKKLQKKYFTRSKDIDGKYGKNTDILLRHVYNVHKYAGKNFKPQEFKCGCGGKYCTGYPNWMKKEELAHLQRIRTHFGKSMTITSGIRCKGFNNSLRGSSKNSAHLTGRAVDFYMPGVTDTLENRKKTIAWLKKQPYHHWSYGNGWCSLGYAVNAPNMGNAIHTDTSKAPKGAKIPDVLPKKKTTAQKLISAADAFCYPIGTAEKKWKYSSGKPKAAYKSYSTCKARITLSDCGYFILTCFRKAGVGRYNPLDFGDPVPKKLKVVHKGKIGKFVLKRSDVLAYKKYGGTQHTLMYYGGGYVAEAGRGIRFPIIHKSNKYNAAAVRKDTIRVLRAR